MKISFLILLFAICLTKGDETPQIEELVNGLSNFTIEFLEQCARVKSGNFMVSPFSVAMALMELANLANGTYFEEIRNALHLKSDRTTINNQFRHYLETIMKNKGDVELIVANGILLRQNSQVENKLQDISALGGFSSDVEFASFEEANYCKKKERTIVESQMDNDPSENILMSATNVRSQFHPWVNRNRYRATPISDDEIYKTREYDPNAFYGHINLFYITGDFPKAILKDLSAEAVKMDYKNSSLSIITVHPIDIDISTLETRMKNYTLKRIDEQMGWPWRDKMHGIRKIKIQTELDLSEILKKMGITEIFAGQSNSSDFPNSNGKKIKIEKIIHKVEFDFTQQHLGYWSKHLENRNYFRHRKYYDLVLKCQLPHLLYIWDRSTDTILFSGRIANL